ncbi:MAG: UDP-glucose dehydrogenase family protein [Gammaproteobacteria bacterium]
MINTGKGMRDHSPRLSIIGLGKLGSPMVAVFAHKGFQVIGLDINHKFVAALAEGRAPVEETGLQQLIDQSRDRIHATTNYEVAVQESDITFIIVPTPSGPDRFFTNKYVVDAVTRIGEALQKKSEYHLVVVASTVMPGSTGGEIRVALEAASGRRVGPTLGLCYSPEFIALGSIIHDLLLPDMILIGESDAKAGQILEDIYRRSTDSGPEIHRMNFVNAELTKISVNTYVTTKISYANMIGEICDHLPGADADIVNLAVGADSRIGRKYLQSAVGYGGPCFRRDNKAFAALGHKLGVRCDLAEATDRINDHQLARLQGAVEASASPGQTVAVLGLSYKPGTNVVEEAQGVMLAKLLADRGYRVVVFDPLASGNARAVLGARAAIAPSAPAAVRGADVVVISTPCKEFKSLRPEDVSEGPRPRTIIDPWRVLSAETAARVVRYVVLGKGIEEKADDRHEISKAFNA